MTIEAKTMECWICGEKADTGEHRTKASDLRSLFGIPTQANPLYFHTARRKNVKVATLRAPELKFTSRLCNRCNSTRTQPHDFAWQYFSETLRTRQPPIASGYVIRLNRIFPYNTARAMLNVHLYFIKVFGCQILEGKIPIDIAPFSKAILQERPHPNVYLAFRPTPASGIARMAGGSDVVIAMLKDQCAFATWFYEVGSLSVNIMYAIDGEKRDGLANAWHPRFGHKRLTMAAFIPDEPTAPLS